MLFVKDKGFYKTFFVLTLSIALQNVIVFSVNLADNIMLGAYNETALSGVALVNQIQFLLQMLIMGIGEGMIVLAARYWGRGDIESIRKVTNIGLRLGIICSLLLFSAVFFFPDFCLGLFTNDAAVIGEGVQYLKIICFSYLFFAMTNVLISTLRSVETVKIAFIVSFSTLIINVCLNYVLIYGNFGAPRLGARGAAIATLTARIIEFIIMFVYIKYFDKKILLRMKHLKKIDFTYLKSFFKIGIPVVASNALWGIAMGVQTAILGHMGAAAIAANSIATTIFQILSVVAYGSSSATAVVIGKTIGEGKNDLVKQYAVTLQMLYLGIGIASGIGLYLFKDFILQFYTISEETRQLALQFITVLSVTIIGTTYEVACLVGIVRSGGDTKFVLYNDTIFMWMIVIPASALSAFVFHLSPLIVFICLKSDQILKCFVAVIKVNRFRWIRNIDTMQSFKR